jgi:hypothetical protein
MELITFDTTFGQVYSAAKELNADVVQQVHRDEKTNEVICLLLVARGESAASLHEAANHLDSEIEEDDLKDREESKQVEAILASLPIEQRRSIERYFNFVSETSINEEIARQVKQQGFESLAEYERILLEVGTTPRVLALAEILGH